jgi:hypothetical protein
MVAIMEYRGGNFLVPEGDEALRLELWMEHALFV